jgi:hypothetical protein
MRAHLGMAMSKRFMLRVLIVLLSTVINHGRTNAHARQSEERLLRAAIGRALDYSAGELKYVSKRFDLNGDGRVEVLVWISTTNMGGTSGYPLLVFSRDRNGYRLLWSFDQVWTPLIVLDSSHHGWHDLAFQMGGGGDAMHYVACRHNGKSYSDDFRAIKASRVRGHWLIRRNWQMSIVGPLPTQ